MVKFLKKINTLIIISVISVFLFNSCSEEPFPSLYEDIPTGGPTPVITSISPAEALGGVTDITIEGLNFSPKPEENLVSFNGTIVPVLNASTTQLFLKAPNVVGDSVYVKIAVNGTVNFSDTLIYKVNAASEELYGFQNFEKPNGMTVDLNSNVYFSLKSTGLGAGVKKITPTDSLFDFAPPGIETQWTSLKIGPGGILYAAKDVRGIWKIEEGVTPPNQPYILPPSGAKIYDFDYDANGNIWAGGANTNIFRVNADLTVTTFPFTANLKSVRVFENYLYVAGLKDSVEGVWRFPITGNDLGEPELYFNLSEIYDGKALAVTFALDGDMYIGTDAFESIVIVHPDRSHEPLYPGIFQPSIQNFCWGTGTKLYATRSISETAGTILVIEMQKQGAPNYGRDL